MNSFGFEVRRESVTVDKPSKLDEKGKPVGFVTHEHTDSFHVYLANGDHYAELVGADGPVKAFDKKYAPKDK